MREDATSRERALTLERELQALLLGQLTPGSGSKGLKGDVRSELFLAEAKYRSRRVGDYCVIQLDLNWFETISYHASRTARIPLLAVEFADGRRLAFVPAEDYWSAYHEVWDLDDPEEKIHHPLLVPRRLPELCYSFNTPTYYRLEQLRSGPPTWVALTWPQLAELRRLLPLPAGSPPPARPLGRRLFRAERAPIQRRPFRARPKE